MVEIFTTDGINFSAKSANEPGVFCEKETIEKEVKELEGQESDSSKEQLNIAKAKVDALNSDFYQKI